MFALVFGKYVTLFDVFATRWRCLRYRLYSPIIDYLYSPIIDYPLLITD